MIDATTWLARLEAAARPTRTGPVAWRSWGAGQPLVMLHGRFGSWRHWARNIDGLAAERQLLLPDLPSMGDSDAPERPIGRPEAARLVGDGLVELLGDEAFDLVGFSYGGLVAALLAARAPERVRSLTLVGSAGFGSVRSPLAVKVAGLKGTERRDAHRCNLARLMIADPLRVDELAVEIQEQNTSRYRPRLGPDGPIGLLPDLLASYTGPVNAWWGSRDQFASDMLPARVARLHAGRPAADIRLFEGAGHWVAYERAAEFDAHLLSRLGA